MHAAVESPNGPNGGEPRENESPPSRPIRHVLSMAKYVRAIVPIVSPTDRKSDDCRRNEYEVHDDKHGLKLAHDLGQCRCKYTVKEDTTHEDAVDFTVAGGPITIP